MNSEQVQKIFEWLFTFLPNYDEAENEEITGTLGGVSFGFKAVDLVEMGFAKPSDLLDSHILRITAVPLQSAPLTVDKEFAVALNAANKASSNYPMINLDFDWIDEDAKSARVIMHANCVTLAEADILRFIDDLSKDVLAHNEFFVQIQTLGDA